MSRMFTLKSPRTMVWDDFGVCAAMSSTVLVSFCQNDTGVEGGRYVQMIFSGFPSNRR